MTKEREGLCSPCEDDGTPEIRTTREKDLPKRDRYVCWVKEWRRYRNTLPIEEPSPGRTGETCFTIVEGGSWMRRKKERYCEIQD